MVSYNGAMEEVCPEKQQRKSGVAEPDSEGAVTRELRGKVYAVDPSTNLDERYFGEGTGHRAPRNNFGFGVRIFLTRLREWNKATIRSGTVFWKYGSTGLLTNIMISKFGERGMNV